jgi:uncharacterized protein YkwD
MPSGSVASVRGAFEERVPMGILCRTASIAMACAALVAASPATAAEDAERMIEAINELRAAHGLEPLAVSEALTRNSERHAAWQLRAGWFGHAGRIDAPGNWAVLGEAIAVHRGHRPRVPATVRRWAESPSHAYLLLSPLFDKVGAGLAHGRLGRGRATVWVLRLGSR